MDLEQVKSIIQLLPIPQQNKQKAMQAFNQAAQIVNPQTNYTKDEALKLLQQNNVNMAIIDNMLPLINNPIAERIMKKCNINKNDLISDLQELRGNQPQNKNAGLTNRNSAIFKELDQF